MAVRVAVVDEANRGEVTPAYAKLYTLICDLLALRPFCDYFLLAVVPKAENYDIYVEHLILFVFLDVSAFLSLELPRPMEFDLGDLLDYLRFFVTLGFRSDDPFCNKVIGAY